MSAADDMVAEAVRLGVFTVSDGIWKVAATDATLGSSAEEAVRTLAEEPDLRAEVAQYVQAARAPRRFLDVAAFEHIISKADGSEWVLDKVEANGYALASPVGSGIAERIMLHVADWDKKVSPCAAYDAALAEWRGATHTPECRTQWDEGDDGGPDGTQREDGRPTCPACFRYMGACDAFTVSLGEVDPDDSGGAVGREALCADCGQAFNPVNHADLIHILTTVPAGQKWGPGYTVDLPEGPERYCGGRGEHAGYWV
jgi:hypothetical protein